MSKVDGRTSAGKKALTEVVTSDLRALLFWASVGVHKSKGGSYPDIGNILDSYADYLGFKLPHETKVTR